MEGFVRSVERADGKRELIWQEMSMSRELRMITPAPVVKNGKDFREGSPLKLAHPLNADQLFGFTWGDWDNDGREDFAILQSGEHLRLYFSDAKSTKWDASDSYGGTKSDFGWENGALGTLMPRMLNLKASEGKTQLLVPHNISNLPFHMGRLKVFKSAEILDLAWNGTDMNTEWTLPTLGNARGFCAG